MIFCNKCIIKKNTSLKHKSLSKICKNCLSLILKIEEKSLTTPALITLSNNKGLSNSRQASPIDQIRSNSILSNEEPPKIARIYKNSKNISQEINELQQEINNEDNRWEYFCKEYLAKRTKTLLGNLHLSEDLSEIVVTLVDCVVKGICSSVQFRGDSMDIANFVRIQPILFNDRSFSNFMSGIAFPKNLASKKMNKFLQNPRILMIKKVTDINQCKNDLVSMNILLEQEDSLEFLVLQNIINSKPSLIVCNGSLTQPLITELCSIGVSAIVNVKLKLMNLIARATFGKVLGSCDEIPYEANFIGECNSFYLETRGNVNLVHFTGLKDRSLVGTIFISGPDQFELASLKKVMKNLIVEYRNARIEKSLLLKFNLQNSINLLEELKSNSIIFKHFI